MQNSGGITEEREDMTEGGEVGVRALPEHPCKKKKNREASKSWFRRKKNLICLTQDVRCKYLTFCLFVSTDSPGNNVTSY